MKRWVVRLLLVGLVVMGVALLSGCELLNQFIAIFTGNATFNPGAVVSGRMKINLAATVWRDDGYTGAKTYAGSVAGTFWAGAGMYDEVARLYTAYSWNGGDFSNTWFSVALSANETTITSFSASQTQANAFLGYTYMHIIDGGNVPFSHIDGNSRYYRIEGTAARTLVTAIQYEAWVPSSMSPGDWITGGPAALTGDAGDYIEIRLDYQNQAVAPAP